MNNSEEWTFRLPTGADVPFIYSTWANSMRYSSVLGKSCRNTIFFKEYTKVIDRILSQPDTETLIACFPEQPTVIFGYIVFQGPIIHYVFVKEAFQKQGIAKSLVAVAGKAFDTYTHKTFILKHILERFPELTYNPFHLYKTGVENG
jgi:GNAT superfamily N-acetyltransferase